MLRAVLLVPVLALAACSKPGPTDPAPEPRPADPAPEPGPPAPLANSVVEAAGRLGKLVTLSGWVKHVGRDPREEADAALGKPARVTPNLVLRWDDGDEIVCTFPTRDEAPDWFLRLKPGQRATLRGRVSSVGDGRVNLVECEHLASGRGP